jgi:hypothetical protein
LLLLLNRHSDLIARADRLVLLLLLLLGMALL